MGLWNNPATLEDSFNTSSLTDVEQGVFQVKQYQFT